MSTQLEERQETIDQTTKFTMPAFKYWRFVYQLVHKADKAIIGGPVGFGVMVSESDTFPTAQFELMAKTDTFELVMLSTLMIEPNEYKRLLMNNSFDFNGYMYQCQQEQIAGRLHADKMIEEENKKLIVPPDCCNEEKCEEECKQDSGPKLFVPN